MFRYALHPLLQAQSENKVVWRAAYPPGRRIIYYLFFFSFDISSSSAAAAEQKQPQPRSAIDIYISFLF